MTIKLFNSVGGYSVGESNVANIILANGDVTTNNITVSNRSNLGSVSNVIITGGNANYFLKTDGLGNLSWAEGGGGSPLSVSEANANAGNISNTTSNVSGILFDRDSGFSVSNVGNGNVLIQLGSTFKTWVVTGQSNLVAQGEDTVQFIAGNNLVITTSNTPNPPSDPYKFIRFDADVTFISNGNSNVSIPATDGNVIISAAGNANILVITGTGANVTGTLDVTSNIITPNLTVNLELAGNTANFSGNVILPNLTVNTELSGNTANFSGNVISNNFTVNLELTGNTANFSGNVILPNLTVNTELSGNTANFSGNVISNNFTVNLELTGNTANFNSASIMDLTVSNTANLGNIGNLTILGGAANYVLSTDGSGVLSWQFISGAGAPANIVNGNSNVDIPVANGNVIISAAGNANILVITGTGANITGTANITGNANIGNLGVEQILASANITAPQLISNVSTGTAPLVVTSTTVVANLNANALQGNTPNQTATANSIAQRNEDGNITANFFIGNGSQLTGLSTSSISNGNSNVDIPAANGNVNISAVGNANVLVVTGTGANITGTANVTGTVTSGAVTYANTDGTNGQVLTTYGNGITYWSTVSGGGGGGLPLANGTSNINIPVASGNITFGISGTSNALVFSQTEANFFGGGGGNISGANVISANVLTATANVSGGNIVTSGQLVSSIVTGTAPLVVTSTTVVANLNANALQGNTPSQTATANSIAQRNEDGNITANFFIGNGSQLTGLTISSISNGNSSINIPTANGNIELNSAGAATPELIITSTGANVNGTLNATGNVTTANIFSNTALYAFNNFYKHNALGSGSGARTIDLNLGDFVSATATGACQWTVSNTVGNSAYASIFVLELTNGGVGTQTWMTNTKWPSGTAPTLQASGVDVLVFMTDDNGAIWRGVLSMSNSS